MKLAKATIYFYDANDVDSCTDLVSELKSDIERGGYIDAKLFDVKEVEIGQFYDDIKINYENATKEDYEVYFNLDYDLLQRMVTDFNNLSHTRKYHGISYDDIFKKVMSNHRKLNYIELEYFKGQIEM